MRNSTYRRSGGAHLSGAAVIRTRMAHRSRRGSSNGMVSGMRSSPTPSNMCEDRQPATPLGARDVAARRRPSPYRRGGGAAGQTHEQIREGHRSPAGEARQAESRTESFDPRNGMGSAACNVGVQGGSLGYGWSEIHLTTMPGMWACRQAQSQNTGNLQVCPMRTRVKRRYQRCNEHQGVGDWRCWTYLDSPPFVGKHYLRSRQF